MFQKKLVIGLFGITAICTFPIQAGNVTHEPNNVEIDQDFSSESSVSGHLNWSTWTPGGGSGSVKYYRYAISPDGDGSCFLVQFDPGTGTESNTDLRLWDNTNNSIDDDGPGSNRLPQARIWTTGATYFLVSAYSTTYNSVDFSQSTYILSENSAAACDNGTTAFWNADNGTINQQNTTAD
jgi:hypothetical protein